MLSLWAVSLVSTPARAAHELLQLFVTQPYLELHTGPGRGYPVTQVVARGESVDSVMSRLFGPGPGKRKKGGRR